jgi:Spy/CpxP family protein refolding chaperone
MTDREIPNTQSAQETGSPTSSRQTTPRSRALLVGLTLALAVGLIGTVAGSAFGHWSEAGPGPWRYHGGFGRGFGGAFGPASIEERADRAVRHLAVEIDASAEQQEKLRAIVKAAVKDLVPMRDRMQDTRQKARELLTQSTVDRAAIERLRADQMAAFDGASRRVTQALAEAAEVLTPEQRRKLGDLVPPAWSGWGRR